MAKEEKQNMCSTGMCLKCHAGKLLILGLIFLINNYWPFMAWWGLIGWLLVIGGLIKMIWPCCSHCK